MAYLVDTPILLRLANNGDAQYAVAVHAIAMLHGNGEVLHITPQNLIEFRNAATRPTAQNGLGFSPAIAERQSTAFETKFSLLPETPDIFPAWKALVAATGVIGKQVHDARLAAICHVHGVSHALTFNVRHFSRFSGVGPGLTVVDPSSIK